MIQIITLGACGCPRRCDHHHRRHDDAATPTDVTDDDDIFFILNFFSTLGGTRTFRTPTKRSERLRGGTGQKNSAFTYTTRSNRNCNKTMGVLRSSSQVMPSMSPPIATDPYMTCPCSTGYRTGNLHPAEFQHAAKVRPDA